MPSPLAVLLLLLLLPLAMMMLCMWHCVGARILGVVMHSAKHALLICLLCIGATVRFLQFAPTVRVVVLGAGSSFFAASFARGRALGSGRSRLRPRCAPLCLFLRDSRALSANSPPARLTPSFDSCVPVLAQIFASFAPSSTSFIAGTKQARYMPQTPRKHANISRQNRVLSV